MEKQIAISDTFFKSLFKIPSKQQKKVKEFISKFKLNFTSASINLEKLHNTDENIYSARIDEAYRVIIFKSSSGNAFILLWVDHHDDAYQWAKRYTCKVNINTGVIQLLRTEEAVEQLPNAKTIEKTPENFLFKDYDKQQLLNLGVPTQYLDKVLNLSSESELEQLETVLPIDAWESIYLLNATGDYPSVYADKNHNDNNKLKIKDENDIDTALSYPDVQYKFMLVKDNDEELEKMLNSPSDEWRVFLHPSQRKLVNKNWKGSVKVTGGAGTGKTVVAMHRAKWLTERLPPNSNKKILFTTFTKNLAVDIQLNLKKICNQEILNKIEVINIDSWVYQFLKKHSYNLQIVYDDNQNRKKCWDNAVSMDSSFSDDFYRREWKGVIQEQNIQTMKEYFKASRIGRGTPLDRKKRKAIWKIFEEYRIELETQGLIELSDAINDAIKIIEEKNIHLYDAIIIDESQDMGNKVFTLLRKMIPEKENDLFIVGDGYQRIYNRKVNLKSCGIKVIGRSKKLKINYRTTEEIRKFAMSVMHNMPLDDLDDNLENTNEYISLYHGHKPIIEHFNKHQEEINFIKKQINLLSEQGISLQDICLVARTQMELDKYAKILNEDGIEIFNIKRNKTDSVSHHGVRLATMHRIKGLEFKYIFIVAVNEGKVPLSKNKSDDIVEQKELDFNERALFHVAATRARTQLFILSYGKKSHFLPKSAD